MDSKTTIFVDEPRGPNHFDTNISIGGFASGTFNHTLNTESAHVTSTNEDFNLGRSTVYEIPFTPIQLDASGSTTSSLAETATYVVSSSVDSITFPESNVGINPPNSFTETNIQQSTITVIGALSSSTDVTINTNDLVSSSNGINYYVYNNKFLYDEIKFEELASGNWIIE